MRILIGYASRFGSTRDIAIRIGGALRARGYEVDVRPVDAIADFDHCDAWCSAVGVRRIVVGGSD